VTHILPLPSAHLKNRHYLNSFLIFISLAIATRFQQFGNPIIHIDEQFYLLVGDRMLHGMVPYIDIFDRKPIGLFLLYAAIRCLGGSGIIQYQLVAAAFAVGTAWVIFRSALRITNPTGATLAGALYLLWIPLLTGQGGQSPVFYNFFVALAAWLIMPGDREASDGALLKRGTCAMLLIGIALQIKYSALFEGMFFGIYLLWRSFRLSRMRHIVRNGTLWVAAALLPTIIAASFYWWRGSLAEFWFANFESIRLRGSLDAGDSAKNAATLALYLSVLLIVAASGAKAMITRRNAPPAAGFVTGWLLVALVSVIGFGYYFDHYGLPVVAPAALCAAPFLGDRKKRLWSSLVLAGALGACLLLPYKHQRLRGTPAEFNALVSVIAPFSGGGLLVWDNLPALYYATHAPLPGRYPFPTHLRDNNELGAIGVDRDAELARIMANQPKVVVVEQGKPGAVLGESTLRLMGDLRRDYHVFRSVTVGRRNQLVYLRN
jgi:hypothetical protein